jgi:arylsulfatase A-like enzyme
MILTDEHSLRTLGCYRDFFDTYNQTNQGFVWGDGIKVETPNIDRLATEGAMFTNFYTVAPLCTPSRASFMSGLYPQKTGETEDNHGRINNGVKTFANNLEEKDYLTGYFGKWHLNGSKKPGWSRSNRRFGFEDRTFQYNRGHWKFLDIINGTRKEYEFDKQNLFEGEEDKQFTTDFLFDRGIEFMKKAKKNGRPFASVLSIPDPHGPMEVRQPYQDMYKHMKFNLPYTARAAVRKNPAPPDWNYHDHGDVPLNETDAYLDNYENGEFFQSYLQQYFGMVKCIDDNVGKLLKFLDKSGIDKETIIV